MRAFFNARRMFLARRSRGLAAVIAAAVAVAGCASGPGGPVAYTPQGLGRPDVQGQAVADSSAPIGVFDQLVISVFQVESLSGEFKVDSSGKIDYPLIGAVQAQGRTTEQLRGELATALSAKYLRSPNVSVQIKERAEQTVTVDGAVRNPGVYKVKGPTSLLQAVALASGTSEDANPSRVVVFRSVRGEKVAGAFDLKQIRMAQAPDPVIYGNDIVVVGGGPRAQKLFNQLLNTVPMLSVLSPF